MFYGSAVNEPADSDAMLAMPDLFRAEAGGLFTIKVAAELPVWVIAAFDDSEWLPNHYQWINRLNHCSKLDSSPSKLSPAT